MIEDLSQAKRFMAGRTRRSFLTAGVATVAAVGSYEWMRSRPRENGVPWPERRVLRANESIAHGYLSNRHRSTPFPNEAAGYIKPNGDYGLDDDLDADAWRLNVRTGATEVALTMSDILTLPPITQVVQFFCIEGWSAIVEWTGVRFRDFTSRYLPPGAKLPRYVSMETPDSKYYVGLDIKSAMHPQTLLCYRRNGQPLEEEHGAPLRLLIPVKYGIKNLKRIGTIRYTDTRPRDYWEEQGYDWYAGL